jgi:hypothetical protein
MLVRLLAATVAGGIAFFGFGFVIYGLVLDPYMRTHMAVYPGLMKEPMPEMVSLVAANLINALVFAFIFDYWAGIRTFVGGLKGGAILMSLIVLSKNLEFIAFMNIWKDSPIPMVVFDVIGATVLGALAGGVIGLVLGLMGRKAEPAAAEAV